MIDFLSSPRSSIIKSQVLGSLRLTSAYRRIFIFLHKTKNSIKKIIISDTEKSSQTHAWKSAQLSKRFNSVRIWLLTSVSWNAFASLETEKVVVAILSNVTLLADATVSEVFVLVVAILELFAVVRP